LTFGKVRIVASGALGLVMTAAAFPASAQVWPADSQPVAAPVYEMPRPFYNSPGIVAGSFLLFPTMSENVAEDDNVFASNRNRTNDLVNTTSEALSIASQWSRHRLGGHLFAAQELYARHSSNNGYFWGADASGRVDITSDAWFQLDGGFVQQPLARGTAEAGTERTRPLFNTSELTASYAQRLGTAVNRLQFSLRDIAYVSDGDATRSGTRYTYRDRVSYDLSPGMTMFLEGAYAELDWLRRPELRDSDLLTGLAGIALEIPGRIQAEFGAGVLRQGFRNGAFDTLIAPIVRERLTWNVLPLTSIVAGVDRTILGTETFCDGGAAACQSAPGGVLPGAAQALGTRNSLETTTADIAVQHEFWHDILGQARFRYQRDHFDFNGLTDKTYVFGVNARYLINRFLEADFDYTYRRRSANLPADRTFNSGPFTENVVSLTLKGAL